jgi:alkylation response protein AidB-like acyl-CoA dehydrogenase
MPEPLHALPRVIADVVAPAAAEVDRTGTFPSASMAALRDIGILGLTTAPEVGGGGAGLDTAAQVIEQLAAACGSTAMIVLMHYAATAAIETAGDEARRRAIAGGGHLTTLAFSEAGSRSHFWAPVSRARRNGTGVRITAKKSWVTSAGYAQSYVISSLASEGTSPTDSTLFLVPAGARGLSVAGPWDGLGLRANASAPMVLDDCEVPSGFQLTEDGAGFQAMLEVVLPLFNLGSAAVALGLCRAAVTGTATHLKSARFEHLGQSLGESLPTLRAQLATMQIDTDGLSARIDDLVDHLERPRDTTVLRVLESKAAAGEVAISVTSAAMRACGGSAFSKQMNIERLFRDAHAGAVMAPTSDVLREFISKSILGMPLF